MTCALSRPDHDKIEECETTQEIWITLRTTHEGIHQVKDSKVNILNHKFERFKMQEHESIKEIFTRFTTVVNELNALGKKYTTHQRIKKIMRSLLKI